MTKLHKLDWLQRLSLRTIFVTSAVLAVAGVAAAIATGVWSTRAAEKQLLRSKHSYEQLALATQIEADIGRLLISEIWRIVDGERPAPEDHRVRETIGQLIERIDEEVRSLDSETERADERLELVEAHALLALFDNMQHGVDRHRTRISKLDSGSAVRSFVDEVVAGDFAQLSRTVLKVVAGEREEVAASLAAVQSLRQQLASGSLVMLTLAALIALFVAILAHRAVVRPLNDLSRGSAALAAGDDAHRVVPHGPVELRRLGECFNEMAGRIVSQKAELLAANSLLEGLVAERTEQLEIKARRLAGIDANRRLFFAKISHELRTPLTALLGEADLALKSGESQAGNDPVHTALTHILINGELLKRRIADLLALARSEDGLIAMEARPIDLRSVVCQSIQATEAYARSCDVAFEADLGVRAVPLIGDGGWISQSLLAVFDNAIKFSPPDSRIRIALEVTGGDALVRVTDDGPGIPNTDLPHVFDAYFQAASGRLRSGAGLGLTVAKWVAAHHGGTISAENIQPRGLAVTLTLPISS
ncbi:MAG: HAMP domain-containing sensor histidine kinase [Hyphomicrobium sp.]